MSEFDDAEDDVHEFAEQLGYTDELGRHDMSDPNLERATTKSSRGLSRRDLVVKGGLGAVLNLEAVHCDVQGLTFNGPRDALV